MSELEPFGIESCGMKALQLKFTWGAHVALHHVPVSTPRAQEVVQTPSACRLILGSTYLSQSTRFGTLEFPMQTNLLGIAGFRDGSPVNHFPP